jgi:hypothetical protein
MELTNDQNSEKSDSTADFAFFPGLNSETDDNDLLPTGSGYRGPERG